MSVTCSKSIVSEQSRTYYSSKKMYPALTMVNEKQFHVYKPVKQYNLDSILSLTINLIQL